MLLYATFQRIKAMSAAKEDNMQQQQPIVVYGMQPYNHKQDTTALKIYSNGNSGGSSAIACKM